MFQTYVNCSLCAVTPFAEHYMNGKSEKEKVAILNAVKALEVAIEHQRFIKDSNYKPDVQLSEFWLDVADLFKVYQPEISSSLREQASFWDDPANRSEVHVNVSTLYQLYDLMREIRDSIHHYEELNVS